VARVVDRVGDDAHHRDGVPRFALDAVDFKHTAIDAGEQMARAVVVRAIAANINHVVLPQQPGGVVYASPANSQRHNTVVMHTLRRIVTQHAGR